MLVEFVLQHAFELAATTLYLYTRMIHVMKKETPMVEKYASGMLYERRLDVQSGLVPLDKETFWPPSSSLQLLLSV